MQPQRLEPTVVVEVNEWIRHPPRRPSSNNESTDTGSGLATEGDAMDGNLEIARLVNLVGVGRVLASTNTPVLSSTRTTTSRCLLRFERIRRRSLCWKEWSSFDEPSGFSVVLLVSLLESVSILVSFQSFGIWLVVVTMNYFNVNYDYYSVVFYLI
jgi:hypothetical protein